MFRLNKEDDYELPGQRVKGQALQAFTSSEEGEGTLDANNFEVIVEARP